MNIRLATMADLEEITAVEAACFPAAEAAGRESFRKRLEVFPNHFWLLVEAVEEDNFGEQGESMNRTSVDRIISIINGMATDILVLADEMFEDASMHREDGAWQMIFGVETIPEYRGQGCAKKLMQRVIEDTRLAGRKGLMLTCKEALIPFYEQFGYVNEGKSASTHGGAVWYDMRLRF